ncbi:acidic repeat-containing protein isoform X1 [Apis mellifera caucasica]|nr:acidic repeat-containing protein isoform X1 [Apis mellifera caucasica]KAG9435325.1 acidic repeat-containing protein isoform X1 [Apis mellifera carnica]
MTNLPDSQSDSSLDIVPLSNKHDKSSGNSSLERLEMNYETPNNRGKINQLPNESKTINSKCNKTSNPTVLRQTIINEFVQKTKNNEFHTSHKTHTNDKFSIPINTSTNTPQNIDIRDCADILDKLYGKSWRNKADILFPKSEPRINTIKQATTTKNRAVQTERKIINRERLYISDSDSSSNTSLKDLKLQNRSKKKSVRKNMKRKDDTFINDQTSSGSENESLYYTALTHPRVSQNSIQSKTVFPSIVQRAIKICDTDSEDNDDIDNGNQIFNIRGRKLFNNESEDSSTSEFDPGDEIPPKSTIKKDFIKTIQEIPKSKTQNKLTSDNSNNKKHKSFLASLSENVPLTNIHPDAKKYRLDYKNNKENLCKYLYNLYNDKVFDNELPEDMLIEWNVRMRGTAGFCYNKKSVKTLGGIVKSSRIVLATKILDTPDRLRDTLIHEMCHAAAWLINGISDGHGPFWTKWASKAMKIFPELPPIRRCHDYKIKTKFTYKCINCGYSIGRHSKSLDIEKKRCGHCYGKFELLLNKTTKSGTIQMQTPKREPSAFALYVKENYNSVKKERNIGHAAVMKLLGQQFSAIKIAKKQENIENNPNIIN